jgi:hypothetical protein
VIPYSKGIIEADLKGISPLEIEENENVIAALSELKSHLTN